MSSRINSVPSTKTVNFSPGTHVATLQDVINHMWSAGACLNGLDLTEVGDGTINITAGCVVMRLTDSIDGDLKTFTLDAVNGITPVNNKTNLIYADYNSGTPVITITDDIASVFDSELKVLIHTVNRLDTQLNIIDNRGFNIDYARKNSLKDFYVKGIEHASGAVVSDEGSGELSITAGMFFALNEQVVTPSLDTSVAGVFEYIYRDGAGGHTRVASQTAINYAKYDDGTGTLGDVGVSKYACHYIYAVLNTPSHYKVIYGIEKHNSISDAQNEAIPTDLPTDVMQPSTSILISKIIVKGGSAVFVDIQTPFVDTLKSSTPSSHNNLSGLQGGLADEYYHLTSEQYANMINSATILTHEPTGFSDPEDVIVSYDSTTRKITLTGTVNAYWRGTKISALVSGWVSDAHDAGKTVGQFLYYNGTTFVWSDTIWSFDALQIAYVLILPTGDIIGAYRETHGFMDHRTHNVLHDTIGTYRESGGNLAGYTADSTTATDRRPTISECELQDEDLYSTLVAHSTQNNYTHLHLTGTETLNFATAQTEIVKLSGNRPYYNEWNGSAFVQTLIPNNDYMSMWLFAVPVTADSDSQDYRFIFMQGQSYEESENDARGVIASDLNLGLLTSLSPEFIFIAQVIVRYTGGNWRIIDVVDLEGTRVNYVSTPAGVNQSALQTPYSNTDSGLDESNVKEALDHLVAPDTITVSGTTKTLALTDVYTVQKCTNTSDLIITVPPNSSVAFPIDTEIAFIRYGTSEVDIAAGSGVTINSVSSELSIKHQYSSCALKKIATDEWLLVGDLKA